jgi:ankyrin repeat protein
LDVVRWKMISDDRFGSKLFVSHNHVTTAGKRSVCIPTISAFIAHLSNGWHRRRKAGRLSNLLFGLQVDVKVQNMTALHAASHQGHQTVVAILLKAGAKVDITDKDGDTAIHFAANG